jgi:O-antigen/teichoic acid export membrane protein
MAATFAGLLSADAVMRLFALAAGLITVRSLSAAGFGSFSYALAFAGILAVTVDFGLSLLLMRDVSARPEEAARLLGSTLAAVAAIGAVGVVGATALALSGAMRSTASAAALLIAFAAVGVDAVGMTFEGTLTGQGRATLLPLVRSVRGITLIAGVALVAVWRRTPETFLLASLVASVAGTCTAAGATAWRATRPSFSHARSDFRQVLRRALPFALLAASYLLYSRIDIVMLGLIDGRSTAGQYGVAVRLLEAVLVVPVYFGSAFLVTISQGGAQRDSAATSQRLARSLRAALLIGVPLSFALALAGPTVVRVLAGHGYGYAGELIARLSPVIALVSCYGVLSNLQMARDRLAVLVTIVAAGAGVKIACNAALIPAFGARGAAATAVGVEAFVVAAQILAARGELRATAMSGWSMRLAAAVLAMVGSGCLLRVFGLQWILALPTGLIAFVATGVLCGAIGDSEVHALRHVFRRRSATAAITPTGR